MLDSFISQIKPGCILSYFRDDDPGYRYPLEWWVIDDADQRTGRWTPGRWHSGWSPDDDDHVLVVNAVVQTDPDPFSPGQASPGVKIDILTPIGIRTRYASDPRDIRGWSVSKTECI